MKGRKIKFRVFFAAFLFGSLIFVIHFMFSEAASEEGFSRIENGMTKEQVLKLLGTPHHEHIADPNKSVFGYGGFNRLKWCTMEVFFDDDGEVSGKFHDH
jgi:outer membrane protein assembly factor BamE (lipoprotein component of BamABCDE complex)